MASSTVFRVFYSWQSDLPSDCTRYFVQDCLKQVKKEIEHSPGPISQLELMESTSNFTGAPHIPETILKNIDTADLFVGDISTINAHRPKGTRATPNPNVAIELGFAVGRLGWDRIFQVFNTSFGNFPEDLPFDLDRRRANHYCLPAGSDKSARNNAISQFAVVLKRAVLEIATKAPPRPIDTKALDLKHQRDTRQLSALLSTFVVSRLQEHCDDIQRGFIADDVLQYYEGYYGIVSSLDAPLYDTTARSLVDELLRAWTEAQPDSQFTQRANRGFVLRAHGVSPTQDEMNAIVKAQASAQPLYDALRNLLKHVHENYLAIDLASTSETAAAARTSFLKDI